MEFVFELIFEIFGEIYLELMTWIVPEEKVNKSKIKFCMAAEAVVLVVALLIGGAMLGETDGESLSGKIIVISSLTIIALQIIFGVIVKIKKMKEEK